MIHFLPVIFVCHILQTRTTVPVRPKITITKASEVVCCVMENNNFGIHSGYIYKKINEAKFMYVFCSNVEDFLLMLMSDMEMADAIAPCFGQLTNLL